jgi:hypothetical protein
VVSWSLTRHYGDLVLTAGLNLGSHDVVSWSLTRHYGDLVLTAGLNLGSHDVVSWSLTRHYGDRGPHNKATNLFPTTSQNLGPSQQSQDLVLGFHVYQLNTFRVTYTMRLSIFIFALTSFAIQSLAQVDYYTVSEKYRTEMFNKSKLVVNAEVVERGRCVRTEDGGPLWCTIRCVVNETYKGKIRKGDMIEFTVREYVNVPLGGKLRTDPEPTFSKGKSFVFFLDRLEEDNYKGQPQYQPVDEVSGIMYPSPGLYGWMRNIART